MSAIFDLILQADTSMSDADTAKDARAELAQLRAQAAELQAAHVYLDESYINDPDAAPMELADRIAPLVAKAAQAEALLESNREQAEAITTLRAERDALQQRNYREEAKEMRDIFSDHVGHVGLYLVDVENGVELRCFARTHGGNDVVLANVSQLHAQAAQAEALQAALYDAAVTLDRIAYISQNSDDEYLESMSHIKSDLAVYASLVLVMRNEAKKWLAAHPSPEQAQLCKCGCGCGNVATTDDGSGRPMCEGCRRDYLGIPPQEQGQP